MRLQLSARDGGRGGDERKRSRARRAAASDAGTRARRARSCARSPRARSRCPASPRPAAADSPPTEAALRLPLLALRRGRAPERARWPRAASATATRSTSTSSASRPGSATAIGVGIDVTHEAMSGATPWYVTPGHERRAGPGDDRGHDRREAHRRAGLGRATTSTAARRRSAAASRPRTTTSPSTRSLGGERQLQREEHHALGRHRRARSTSITPSDTRPVPDPARATRTSRATTATSRSPRCSGDSTIVQTSLKYQHDTRLPLRSVQARVRRRHPGDRRAARPAPPDLVAHALPPPRPVGSRARSTSTTCSTSTTGSMNSHTFELAWYQTLFDRFRLDAVGCATTRRARRTSTRRTTPRRAATACARATIGSRRSAPTRTGSRPSSRSSSGSFNWHVDRGVRALRERRRPRARSRSTSRTRASSRTTCSRSA